MSKKTAGPKAFKHAPSIAISTWYKGILTTQLASEEDTGGAYDFVLANMRKGTEPPPHVHSREDEFFYILVGTLNVYVEGEVWQAEAGECVFLPKLTPHAFLVQSPTIRMLTLITPGGFMNAINQMAAPAERLEIPADDAITYATANLEETFKIFQKYGIRFLRPEEIAQEMPLYPMSLG